LKHMTNRILVMLLALLCATGCATGPGLGNPENMIATICIVPGVDAEAVQDAAEAWNVASNGRVNLTLVMGTECDTVIVAETPSENACGETLLNGSKIKINPDFCGHGIMARKVNTIEHELGHVLTGPDHSTNQADVMWHSSSEVIMPTVADAGRLP
jgi:hypothetical protein